MAKVKYDVSHVEASQFKQPTPGLYSMKVEEANYRNADGKNDIELVLVIIGGEFDGAKLWTYVGLSESAEWKMKELTDALGLPEKGELDTNKLIGKKLKVKVNGDQYQGEYRARCGRFAPISATVGEEPESEPEAETEPEAEAEAEAAEEDTYDEWEEAELLQVITDDEELTEKYPGGFDDDKEYLVGFLRAADAGTLEDWLEENAASVDYTDWTLDELKEEITRRGLNAPKGRAPKSKLIALLVEDDGTSNDPFES